MSNASETLKNSGVHKMSLHERNQQLSELREIVEQLKKVEPGRETAATPELLKNKNALVAKKKEIEERLNKDDDLVAQGGEKDSLIRRKSDLETMIKNGLPTNRQVRMTARIDPLEYERSVNQTVLHQKTHLKNIQEWQEICRRLEPNDPNAGDTSVLYKK